jgi:hypothetical protein
VRLQQEDPDGPGFFQVPARLTELAEAVAVLVGGGGGGGGGISDDDPAATSAVDDGDSAGTSGAPVLSDEERRRRAFDRAAEAWLDTQQKPSGAGAVTGSGSSSSRPPSSSSSSAALAAAAAFDAVVAAPSSGGAAIRRVTLEGSDNNSYESDPFFFSSPSASSSSSQRQHNTTTTQPLDLLCARCFSLTHYGRVRSALAEAAMPEFDLARKVGRKIALQRDRRATVMVVVDITDFDGSLPRAALQALLQGPAVGLGEVAGAASAAAAAARARKSLGAGNGYSDDDRNPNEGDEDASFTLVVAANKFDLLPTQATAARVERWVRLRLRQAGLPRPERVFMTSAATGLGVRPMLEQLRSGMAFREDLWVVGAQNAGKSSLIAAMQRAGAGSGGGGSTGGGSAPPPSSFSSRQPPGLRTPTIAPVPGTTLGVLRVSGIPLGPKQRVFDTPGVPHSHQLTSRLPLAEAAALLPARRLKPRTWRLPEGSTILAGGLVRIDLLEVPGPTMYVTLFAADTVGCHAGKTAAAEERRAAHAGGLLVPPYGAAALEATAAAGSNKAANNKKKKDKKGKEASSSVDENEEDSGGGDDHDNDSGGDPDALAAASKAALVDLPELVPQDVRITGDSWREHTVDVAVAGLGWIAVGCAGPARLRVWAPRGTAVTTHDALIPDYARLFERPGFSRGLPAGGVAAAGGISLKSSGGGGGGGGRGGGGKAGRGGGGGGRGRGGGGGRGRR